LLPFTWKFHGEIVWQGDDTSVRDAETRYCDKDFDYVFHGRFGGYWGGQPETEEAMSMTPGILPTTAKGLVATEGDSALLIEQAVLGFGVGEFVGGERLLLWPCHFAASLPTARP
jgi:hypothetical protein